MPAGSTDAVALAMEATIAARGRIADRRRAATSAIGLSGLVAAILTSALTWSGAACAQGGSWPRSITIGTASPGGVYEAYGEGLARILTRALRIEVTAQVTQGPAQNIVLMEKKEALLGFATMGVALQGWNGTDWAKGTRYRSMRVMFPMYDTAFHFAVLKRFAIKSLDDFAGLRIGVGPRAGTGGTYVPEIFKLLGIAAEIRFGAIDQMASQMVDGKLDGVVIATGFPIPALAELDAKQQVDFVQPSSEQSTMVRNKMPEISPSLIPAGTYRSLARNYHTIGLYNFAIAHKDLSDEFIYSLVKTVFDSRDELMKAQSSAKETLPENIDRNTMLPLHPGALRYYRELGIAVPPGAVAGN
jgi:TRAP transporter TAXI family solute receptor